MNPEQRLKQLKELRDTKRWESIVDSILELAEIIKKETPKEELLAKLTALETSMKEKDDTPILDSITNLSEELKKKEFFTEETFNEVVSEVLSLIEKPKDGEKGADGKDGRDGKDGVDGINGTNGKDGIDGLNGKDGSPDTPDQVIEKVIKSKKLIPQKKIEGLDDLDRIVKHQLYTGISETRALELINSNTPSGGGTWGSITGTLSDQTDLQSALDSKPNGSGTGNWLTYWVTPTILGALNTGTYPNLTELSYLKGVTSSIQTQLNSKLSVAVESFTTNDPAYSSPNSPTTGAVNLVLGRLWLNQLTVLKETTVSTAGDSTNETSLIDTGGNAGTNLIKEARIKPGSVMRVFGYGYMGSAVGDDLTIKLRAKAPDGSDTFETVLTWTFTGLPTTTADQMWKLEVDITFREVNDIYAYGTMKIYDSAGAPVDKFAFVRTFAFTDSVANYNTLWDLTATWASTNGSAITMDNFEIDLATLSAINGI